MTALLRKYVSFIFLLLISISASAADPDSTRGSWNLQLRADYGFVIAHRPALEPLQERHLKGFEVTLARPTSGIKDWENIYHFPNYGITFAYFDLGSPSHLGNGYVLYPFVDFPLSREKEKGLHFRYGMGLGYVQKVFNAENNIKNAAVGSHMNGVIHFDLHYEMNVSGTSALELGAGITHYSNGSYILPNLGINIATVNLAYKHSFGKNQPVVRHETAPVNKKTQYHFYAGGFMKKIYPPLGPNYFACVISGLRFKPISNKSAWGIGGDFFYDNSLSARIEKTEGGPTNFADDIRVGIYGAYHLTVNKLGVMFNMGFYLYNPWKDDGNAYQRICLRYYFEKIFLCLNLKTHYARADFIELGMGVRIR